MYSAVHRIMHNSFWVCSKCGKHNYIAAALNSHRPLGRLECLCGFIPNCRVTFVAGKLRVLQRFVNYSVSVPTGVSPQTKFGWVCCGCGRSHEMRFRLAEAPKPKKPSPLTKLGRSVTHMLKPKNEFSEDKLEADDGEYHVYKTRDAYHINFKDRVCGCHRQICDNCIRYKIPGSNPEEWATEQVTSADLELHPEWLDRTPQMGPGNNFAKTNYVGGSSDNMPQPAGGNGTFESQGGPETDESCSRPSNDSNAHDRYFVINNDDVGDSHNRPSRFRKQFD